MAYSVDEKVVFPVYVRVVDSGDVMRYADAGELTHLEPIDVDNREYEGWDALGRRVQMTAKGVTRGKFVVGGGSVDFCLAGAAADPAFGSIVETWVLQTEAGNR